MEYYDNRPEFEFVGIIDKESLRRKNKAIEDLADVFKIRERRKKILDKKRGTGIPSLKGAVCFSSKSKEYLENIAKKIKLKIKGDETRTDICNRIKKRLLFLEKYSTAEKKNKMTYVMIPKNHKQYTFPYNLEDRAKYVLDQIKEEIKFSISIKTKKIKKVLKEEKLDAILYRIEIKDEKRLEKFKDLFKSLGFVLEGDKLVAKIE